MTWHNVYNKIIKLLIAKFMDVKQTFIQIRGWNNFFASRFSISEISGIKNREGKKLFQQKHEFPNISFPISEIGNSGCSIYTWIFYFPIYSFVLINKFLISKIWDSKTYPHLTFSYFQLSLILLFANIFLFTLQTMTLYIF